MCLCACGGGLLSKAPSLTWCLGLLGKKEEAGRRSLAIPSSPAQPLGCLSAQPPSIHLEPQKDSRRALLATLPSCSSQVRMESVTWAIAEISCIEYGQILTMQTPTEAFGRPGSAPVLGSVQRQPALWEGNKRWGEPGCLLIRGSPRLLPVSLEPIHPRTPACPHTHSHSHTQQRGG